MHSGPLLVPGVVESARHATVTRETQVRFLPPRTCRIHLLVVGEWPPRRPSKPESQVRILPAGPAPVEDGCPREPHELEIVGSIPSALSPSWWPWCRRRTSRLSASRYRFGIRQSPLASVVSTAARALCTAEVRVRFLRRLLHAFISIRCGPERLRLSTPDRQVAGSIPARSRFRAPVAQWQEQLPGSTTTTAASSATNPKEDAMPI